MQSNVITYLQIFFRRKNFFLYPFVVTVFIMVVLSFVLPKSYISTSVILIEEEDVINPLITGLAVSTTAADRLRSIREQILSWQSLVELTRRLKLDSDVRSQFAYEKLLKGLRSSITVDLRGPQLVTISYVGGEPEKVQQIVKTLTEIFIQQNIASQTKETNIAVSFLEDQLSLYRFKIKQDEIKRLQEQLDNLMVDSTGKHPLVKSLKSRIAKLQGELEKDDIEIKVKPKQALDNKEMLSFLILKELQKDSTEKDQALSPEFLNSEGTLFTRSTEEGLPLDTTVNENIYTMLLQRLETARITKQLDAFKEGTRFTIIDPPRLPLKPAKPDPIKFLLLGIVLGCAVGYGCILLVETVDQSFKNISDAKAVLELPVLGSIAAIITEDEYNVQNKGAKFSYFVLGLFFASMIIVVLMYSFLR